MDTSRRDWRQGLPQLSRGPVRLREVDVSDVSALMAFLTTPDTARFIPPPPTTVEGFEAFIRAMHDGRAAGRIACFVVLPPDSDVADGIMSLRVPAAHPVSSEGPWNFGFVFGRHTWGTGRFESAARLMLEFAFREMDLPRVEAWSSLPNGRAHGALAKLGAEPALMKDVDAPDGRHGHFICWTIRRDRHEGR